MKKKLLIIVIFVALVCASIIYLTSINSKFESSVTDAENFKKEYELLNGELVGDTEKIYREVSIDENNTIKLSNYADILERVNNKETFIVYFGFSKCPWCRSVIEVFLREAKNKDIPVYYVDVFDSRDTYKYEDGKIVKTKDASKEYYSLLKKFNNVLSDYTVLNDEGVKVLVGEKRIYAPNMIAVVDGEAQYLTTGISPLQTDSFMPLTDEMLNYSKEEFIKLFNYLDGSLCKNKGC